MRKAWLLLLLSLTAGSASGANHSVGIGVDCDFAGVCFSPAVLTINVGDTVTFFIYGDAGDLTLDAANPSASRVALLIAAALLPPSQIGICCRGLGCRRISVNR